MKTLSLGNTVLAKCTLPHDVDMFSSQEIHLSSRVANR